VATTINRFPNPEQPAKTLRLNLGGAPLFIFPHAIWRAPMIALAADTCRPR
jgi:hypothetical protein